MQPKTNATTERFKFLAEALNGSGGFAPEVAYSTDAGGLYKPAAVSSACHLVPYPRETSLKFASRAAVAYYENHLSSAVERFTGYITRRAPLREGLENPLVAAIVDDADWTGNALDVFWSGFMVNAKARGSMLLLVELPKEQAGSQADAIERRLVPYLTAIEPERVTGFKLDERRCFEWVSIRATQTIDGKEQTVERYWNDAEWRVLLDGKVIDAGPHPFGECPMLAFTENSAFPHVGVFTQIADMSRRVYNARSELDEILRSQTFSLLTYQIPTEQGATFNAKDVAATIGTHNMLVHEGTAPGFIAPPDGPAATYLTVIEQLQDTIRRVGYSVDEKQGDAASGIAMKIRFQALNGALSHFSQRMQDLEVRMWALVSRHLGISKTPTAQWPNDYTLADTAVELSVLAAMQATGFPDVALNEQRKLIAGEAFDSMDEADLAELLKAIDETVQERPAPTDPNNPTA